MVKPRWKAELLSFKKRSVCGAGFKKKGCSPKLRMRRAFSGPRFAELPPTATQAREASERF